MMLFRYLPMLGNSLPNKSVMRRYGRYWYTHSYHARNAQSVWYRCFYMPGEIFRIPGTAAGTGLFQSLMFNTAFPYGEGLAIELVWGIETKSKKSQIPFAARWRLIQEMLIPPG
jgi:hypothetical protein